MDAVVVENPIANEQIEIQQQPDEIGLNELVDDCKEMVFEHLELADLLNVADTNTQLQPMVHQVFERKYKYGRVVIDIENENRYIWRH